MKILARHLTVDMYGCKLNKLDDITYAREAISHAIELSLMTVLDINIKIIEDEQLTVLALLREGHVSIHTYPDLGYAAVDIFTCSENSRMEKIVHALRSILKPEKTKTTYLKRGDFGSVKDMKPRIKISVAPLRRIRNTGARMIGLLKKRKRS